MHDTRIYNADDGTSRFEDGEVSFASGPFAPPAPPVDVSPAEPMHDMVFIRLPSGWTDGAHPAPAQQWMFVLSGRGAITAGGETKHFGPGDAFLVEDTAAPGHASTAHEETVFAVVRR